MNISPRDPGSPKLRIVSWHPRLIRFGGDHTNHHPTLVGVKTTKPKRKPPPSHLTFEKPTDAPPTISHSLWVGSRLGISDLAELQTVSRPKSPGKTCRFKNFQKWKLAKLRKCGIVKNGGKNRKFTKTHHFRKRNHPTSPLFPLDPILFRIQRHSEKMCLFSKFIEILETSTERGWKPPPNRNIKISLFPWKKLHQIHRSQIFPALTPATRSPGLAKDGCHRMMGGHPTDTGDTNPLQTTHFLFIQKSNTVLRSCFFFFSDVSPKKM